MAGLKIAVLLCLPFIISVKTATIDVPKSTTKEPCSLDDVIGNPYTSNGFNGTWISETEIVYRFEDLMLSFDVTNHASKVLARNPLFQVSSLKFSLSQDRRYILIRNVTSTVYRHSSLSVYSIYNIETKSISMLADGQCLSTAFWAPQGSALVYVLKNDIYYHQLSGNEVETRRITFDGKHQAIYNGVPDWVYEEEVLGTDKAMWFSPNGEYLAFATLNDTQVPETVIIRYGIPGVLEDQYPKEEKYRYPKAGATNPQVTLNLIDLTDHGSSLISLKAPVDFVGSEHILFAVSWFGDKTLVATWTNRVQNVSCIASYSLSGWWQPLLVQEAHDGWLLYTTAPPMYHYSGYVLTLKPQPIVNASLGHFSHVTRYRLLNGVLDHETDLTPGSLWVHAIHGINDLKRVVYFTASPPGEPAQKHLYEVRLESAKESKSDPKCISCEVKSPEGEICKYVNAVQFSMDLSHYVLTCSGPDIAPIIQVFDLDGKVRYNWSLEPELRQKLANLIFPQQRDLDIETHGFNAKVRLLLPEDFDPAKKYPLLLNVYAGPNSQKITDAFAVGYETYMSTNRRVIYARIDGRGSDSKGTAMMYAVYRNLGSAEVEDQITVTRKLQQMYPWIDSNRTGIWGWSYGGYSTAMVLEKDEENIFRCGISVAPATDFLYYDSIYTERFMGLPRPEDNLEGYKKTSALSRAEKLHGKKFMLVHGTGDDNVHYQHSMALANELAYNDVLYQQVSYPDESHSLVHVRTHLYHSMDKFWAECFDYDYDAST